MGCTFSKGIAVPIIALTLAFAVLAAQPASGSAPAAKTDPANPEPPKPLDWKTLEAPLLTDHVQLTSRDKFVKAGEAYFDHNSPPRWVIFQAVAVPEKGKEPDPFYAMYVAKLRYDGEKIAGIEEPVQVSPPGSANTCGWFDSVTPHRIIFGSTINAPQAKERPGFRVGTNKYVWQFPAEMEIVNRSVVEVFDNEHARRAKEYDETYGATCHNPPPWPTDTVATPVFARPNYDAECSYSKDGRFILYAHVRDEPTRGKDDADIWIFDTKTGQQHEIVHADGYDGGPFFSPDGKRICYRSDRKGDDLLQLFVADLKFDDDGDGGVPIGITREHQVTANQHVNWAPFWHPSGRFLVYGTSEMGHANYEIFAVEVSPPEGKPVEQLRKRRITYANGADVLPAFSDDGKWMMWTAQRGPMVEGEAKPSSQVWVARTTAILTEANAFFGVAGSAGVLSREQAQGRITKLLRAQDAKDRAGASPDVHFRDYDLSQLRVERVSIGWRGKVNPSNGPDGYMCVLVLDDGRTFVLALNGKPPPDDVRSLMFEPAKPDP
jgi:TolB protein